MLLTIALFLLLVIIAFSQIAILKAFARIKSVNTDTKEEVFLRKEIMRKLKSIDNQIKGIV